MLLDGIRVLDLTQYLSGPDGHAPARRARRRRRSGQPDRTVEPQAPSLGEHNAAVLSELLGYDAARIDHLARRGVIVSG